MEAHTENEFMYALESGADVVGINNRDLDTLDVSLSTSKRLLAVARQGKAREGISKDKLVISESGITTREEILQLSELGADGFLIGSALMKSGDIEEKVRSLTGAAD